MAQLYRKNEWIEDHDASTRFIPETIENLLQALQLTDLLQHIQPLSISLNGQKQTISAIKGTLLKNHLEAKVGYSFDDGDCLEVIPYKPVKTYRLS